MRQRERMVVYCRSDHQPTGQLRIEQVMVEAVDEAEEVAFEKDKMKYFNEELLDSLTDSVVLGNKMNGNAGSVVDFDNSQKNDMVAAYRSISFTTVVHSDETVSIKNSACASNADKVDSSGGTVSSYIFATSDVDNNASFNLTNLRRSLPRLVIKAPEKLHDETSGAFRQYCSVDVSNASMWSARLNSLTTVSRCKPDETEGLLDTSCCSVDSIVTNSSIESGPRTFFDPALHNPVHSSAVIVPPVCARAESLKKVGIQKISSQFTGQQSVSNGGVDSVVDVSLMKLDRSNSVVKKLPQMAGRAVTKLTFSPNKSSEKAQLLVKRSRDSPCSSPCNIKRMCLRSTSTTPNFKAAALSVAANQIHKDRLERKLPICVDIDVEVKEECCNVKVPKRRERDYNVVKSSCRIPPRYTACSSTLNSAAIDGQNTLKPASQGSQENSRCRSMGSSAVKRPFQVRRMLSPLTPTKQSPLTYAVETIAVKHSDANRGAQHIYNSSHASCRNGASTSRI